MLVIKHFCISERENLIIKYQEVEVIYLNAFWWCKMSILHQTRKKKKRLITLKKSNKISYSAFVVTAPIFFHSDKDSSVNLRKMGCVVSFRIIVMSIFQFKKNSKKHFNYTNALILLLYTFCNKFTIALK